MLLNPWNRTTRFALVGLAMIVLGVGACTTSTTTEMEMGQKMTISLSDKSNLEIDAVDADLMAFLNTQPGIENVSVNIREMMNGPVTFEILAWGTGLNAETLEAKMRRQVPSLGSADIQMEALSGTIEESFASKLKREIFQLEVDGASEEEIRAQIMQQLAAQGLENGAVVDVQMEDGMTEIKVKVEKDVPAE